MMDLAVDLPVLASWAELRDVALIALGLAVCLLALAALLFVVRLSLLGYRIVRRLERFHERRVAGSVAAADAQLAAWLEDDRWSAGGILELLRLASERVQARRSPPPKSRRLFGLLPPR